MIDEKAIWLRYEALDRLLDERARRRFCRAKSDGIDAELLLRTLLAWARDEPPVWVRQTIARRSGALPHFWCSMLDEAFGGLIDDQAASKTRCRRSW